MAHMLRCSWRPQLGHYQTNANAVSTAVCSHADRTRALVCAQKSQEKCGISWVQEYTHRHGSGRRRSGVRTRTAEVVAPVAETSTAQQELVTAPEHRHKDVQFRSFDDGVFTVLGRLSLAASPNLVYSILSDYDQCARIFHNITSSVSQPIGQRQLLVTQTCRWSFLAFSGDFDCVFVVEQDSGVCEVEFKLQQSSFMRDFQGRWRVVPARLEHGFQREGCVVEHTLSVKPLMDVPAPIAKLTSSIFVRQVSRIFDDLTKEVDRRIEEEQ